jgi:dipeptidyl aminopeptidase/acylaminoacyl peptidase
MRTEEVTFFSDGYRLGGLLRLPDTTDGRIPAVVQGPGWLGLADASSYVRWHEGLTAAGYGVLVFDYRGFGRSEGERGWVRPDWQLEDIMNAVTFLETRDDIDHHRLGALGMGGTGGGNAIMAAGLDERIRCVAVQSVVADGEDWLHRMRREHEWIDYRARLAADRRRWVTEGTGETVHPRDGLMVETPERASLNLKKDVDSRVPDEFFLRSADFILRYRPIDMVARIAPRALLITCVVDDAVTPEDHAVALYERAGPPKKLIRQSDTTHYRSYTDNYSELMGEIASWYDQHLRYSSIQVRSEDRPDMFDLIDRSGVDQ